MPIIHFVIWMFWLVYYLKDSYLKELNLISSLYKMMNILPYLGRLLSPLQRILSTIIIFNKLLFEVVPRNGWSWIFLWFQFIINISFIDHLSILLCGLFSSQLQVEPSSIIPNLNYSKNWSLLIHFNRTFFNGLFAKWTFWLFLHPYTIFYLNKCYFWAFSDWSS